MYGFLRMVRENKSLRLFLWLCRCTILGRSCVFAFFLHCCCCLSNIHPPFNTRSMLWFPYLVSRVFTSLSLFSNLPFSHPLLCLFLFRYFFSYKHPCFLLSLPFYCHGMAEIINTCHCDSKAIIKYVTQWKPARKSIGNQSTKPSCQCFVSALSRSCLSVFMTLNPSSSSSIDTLPSRWSLHISHHSYFFSVTEQGGEHR